MKVILKSDLFTPMGRFRKTENSRYPTELPDDVLPHLPKTATVVEEPKSDPLPVPKRKEFDDAPGELDDATETVEPATLTEINKTSKGVSALEHFSKKK